jgi:type I restriction enzyme M protein
MPAFGRNAARVRDPKEAEKDLLILHEIMEQVETCEYGLWTNKLDIFYVKKERKRFDIRLEHIADWPLAGESLNEHSPTSRIAFHKADKEMMRVAFRRCHNFIHGCAGYLDYPFTKLTVRSRENIYLHWCVTMVVWFGINSR